MVSWKGLYSADQSSHRVHTFVRCLPWYERVMKISVSVDVLSIAHASSFAPEHLSLIKKNSGMSRKE